MSFFMGDEAPAPRSLQRSFSAREFRSSSPRQTDSSSITDLVFGGKDGEMASARARDTRRKTSLSSSMSNGTNMREAMKAHDSLLACQLAGLRSPRGSSARRYSPSPCSSNRGDNESDCPSVFGGSRRAVSLGPRSSPNGSPIASRRRDSKDSTSSCMSPRAASLVSASSFGGGSSCYNPRAKPGSVASEMSRSMCGQSRVSVAASEDHLWRELFHSEADPQKEARLRGAGKDIGKRNKESKGIPWRQIPGFDRNGHFCESGDPQADAKLIKKAARHQMKKRSQFTGRHDNSQGVTELLAPVSENCENRPPPPPKIDSEAREAWLDTVKRRVEAKYERTAPRYPPSSSANSVSGGCSSVNGGECSAASATSKDVMSPRTHWTWRQLRKGHSPRDPIKDSCPFQRDDSNGNGVKSVQMPPSGRSPPRLQGNFVSVDGADGPEASPPLEGLLPADCPAILGPASRTGVAGEQRDRGALVQAEQVAESRRDWRYSQVKAGRWDCDESFDSYVHSNDDSLGGGPYLAKSASARSFSASTVSSVTQKVHSVHARPGSFRPRWK